MWELFLDNNEVPKSDSMKDKNKKVSKFKDTQLEKSNILLLGPTGCGMY